MGLLLAALLAGCAEPIEAEFYSRTPATAAQWSAGRPGAELRVGVGPESPLTGGAFISYAASKGAFAHVDWLRPEHIENLDCVVECALTFEHEGGGNVAYCLGRLVANVYTPDHSRLIDRTIKFHEAMYTPQRKDDQFTHDGRDVHAILQAALFDELIEHLKSE